MTADLKFSVETLQVKTKAARLRALMPLIEARVREGVRHTDIIVALNEQGFELSKPTYLSILQRYRQKALGARAGGHACAPLTSGVVAPETSPPIASEKVGPKRPPTFEHDPRGIPDLLK